jgi:hypothetical protein
MKIFRRLSKIPAGVPYVRVQVGDDRIYIVAEDGAANLSPLDGVELISATIAKGQRETTGNVSFGHLDRLGNANGAAAARGEYSRRKTFSIERRRGLLHVFQDQAEATVFEADRTIFLAAARDAYFADPEAVSDFAAARKLDLGANVEDALIAAPYAVRAKVKDAKEAAEFAADRIAGLAAVAEREAGKRVVQREDDLRISDLADRAAPSSRTIGRYADFDPRDLDPATGEPVEGYSSPSLDDSFHAGEMAVD